MSAASSFTRARIGVQLASVHSIEDFAPMPDSFPLMKHGIAELDNPRGAFFGPIPVPWIVRAFPPTWCMEAHLPLRKIDVQHVACLLAKEHGRVFLPSPPHPERFRMLAENLAEVFERPLLAVVGHRLVRPLPPHAATVHLCPRAAFLGAEEIQRQQAGVPALLQLRVVALGELAVGTLVNFVSIHSPKMPPVCRSAGAMRSTSPQGISVQPIRTPSPEIRLIR